MENELQLVGPDALRAGDKGYNGDTEGAYVVEAVTSVGIDLVHETTGDRINKMSHRESYEQDWRWFRDDEKATTTTVAQAISFAVDEVQEFGPSDGDGPLGLYLDRGNEDADLRVTEVSAELENAANGLMSQFTIKTSDGQEWSVRVTPRA